MKTDPFWGINKQGKIEINERLLVQFLNQIGFASYYTTSSNRTAEPQFLYKSGNIVDPISQIRIHREVIKKIESGIIVEDILPAGIKNAVVSKLISSKCLTKKETLAILPELDKPLISDTENTAYFFYRNIAVIVTSDNIELVPFEKINGYLWESQIIGRDFVLRGYDEIEEKSEYFQFLKNISSRHVNGKLVFDEVRFKNLISLQGYMLHGYKDKANPRAVILMDVSAKGVPDGRTGKGIIVEGISKIKKTVKEDGKSFRDDNRFKFSQITPDTKILFIDDVKENFVFENFFSATSEGLIVEPKYVNKFFIPFENSPKIVMSTNYAIKGRGSSNEARRYEFELSDFYSDKHAPIDDFGHLFFQDWDKDQWNLFDSLLLISVQEFLDKGVTPSEGINISYQKLKAETSDAFVEWVTGYDLKPNIKYDKGVLFSDYEKFCEKCPDGNQFTFTKRLKIWAQSNNLDYLETHSDINRYIEFRSK